MDINIEVQEPQEITPIEISVATGADYQILENKPQINGVTLLGNKTSEELGLQPQGDYITLEDIPSVEIPTNISAFSNDVGYITLEQVPKVDLSNVATKTELDNKQDKGNYALKSEIPTKTSQLTNNSGFITQHQDISHLATKTELNNKQDKGNYALKTELPTKTSQLTNDSGYITLNDIPDVDIEGVVTDVQANGTSIVTDGVANIPYASTSNWGIVKVVSNYGINTNSNGQLHIINPSDAQITNKSGFIAVTCSTMDKALKNSITTNTIELTDDEKVSACDWIGAVKDVQANGTSVLKDGVANIPIATKDQAGLVRPVPANGINVSNTGTLNLSKLSDSSLANKNSNYAVLVSQIDLATKVGVTTNTIELTEAEKTNACNWLGAARIGSGGGGTGEGGQSSPWVISRLNLIGSATTADEGITLDISNYLPNDGLDYLVYGNMRVQTKEGSDNTANVYVYSDLLNDRTAIEVISTKNEATGKIDRTSGVFLVPIGSGRTISFYNSGTVTSEIIYVRLVMYQQISTNGGAE